MVALYRQGRFDQAISSARTQAARFPTSVFCWKLLGAAYQQTGDLKAALAAKRTAVSLAPDDSEAVANLTNSLEALGHGDAALRAGRQMVKLTPLSPAMHHHLAGILLRSGQSDPASHAYRASIVTDPAFTDAYLHAGNLSFDREQLDSAAKMFLHALWLKPALADASNNLGNVLYAQRKLDSAERFYRRALDLTPTSAPIHFSLGQLWHRTGRLPEALACLRKVLALCPDLVTAHFVLGHVCCGIDDYATAARSFNHVRALDPAEIGPMGALYGAVLSFLRGDVILARSLLADAAPLARQAMRPSAKNRDYATAQAYWVLLDRLLAAARPTDPRPDLPDVLPTLYVVGESHCLAAHRQVIRYQGEQRVCQSEWIAGCKQWHLAHHSRNPQKYRCEAIFARIPRQSLILTLIGEIDCRSDEGLLRAWRKAPETSLTGMIESTIDNFIAYVSAQAEPYGHKIIIGGVPCPLPDNKTVGTDEQVALIRQFNRRLRQQSQTAGMDFLDPHTLTDRGDGRSSGVWHIDGFHLAPAALSALFRLKANQAEDAPH